MVLTKPDKEPKEETKRVKTLQELAFEELLNHLDYPIKKGNKHKGKRAYHYG